MNYYARWDFTKLSSVNISLEDVFSKSELTSPQFLLVVGTLTTILCIAIHGCVSSWQKKSILKTLRAAALHLRQRNGKTKLPPSEHRWVSTTQQANFPTACSVCLEPLDNSELNLSPYDVEIQRCTVCSIVTHLDCSTQAGMNCKRISIPNDDLKHHWVEGSTDDEDGLESVELCAFCHEEVHF